MLRCTHFFLCTFSLLSFQSVRFFAALPFSGSSFLVHVSTCGWMREKVMREGGGSESQREVLEGV